MKKILILTGSFLLMSWAFTSCTKTCETCKQVTYVNGTYDHEGSAQEYCGAELITIKATPDVTIGNTTTKWECN